MELINNKYLISEKIGAGSFGVIYKGKNIRTSENVAIKIEPIKNNTKLLKNESTVYQYLSNTYGVPTVKWFGKDKRNYYMVINLLGESLQNIVENRGNLSLKLTLHYGLQMLFLLQKIHEKSIIHRDVKPDNFLLGLKENKNQLHIIDFGFCKSYIINENHIPLKKTHNVIGSLTYASINSHNCIELSRRDDLESLAYVLLYLYFGGLKWQVESNNNVIKNMKNNIIQDQHVPNILTDFLKNVRALEFEEKPNYSILMDMFKREITFN